MTDNKSRINCPACNKEMHKVFMNEAVVNVDICLDGCGGVFFDNRELEKFDEQHENIDEILESIQNKTFSSVETNEVRICPICNVPMVKMGAGKGGVEIDVCNTCGAKFLDNNELQTIRNSGIENLVRFNEAINLLFEENFENVTMGKAPKKSSARRKFFSDLVYKYLTR